MTSSNPRHRTTDEPLRRRETSPLVRPRGGPASALATRSSIDRRVSAVAQPVRARAIAHVQLVEGLRARLESLDAAIHRWLVAYSVAVLRVALGAVFLGFGFLKFFPGVSPAQGLAEATMHRLTFGLIPDPVAIILIATLECAIGLCLVSGRCVRVAVYLLGIDLVGILSPIVLLTGRLFSGPHGAPTLEGQYVLKTSSSSALRWSSPRR